MLTTGMRLGSYEVVAPLGAGGMGEVYRAVDTRLGRQVAIKVLPEPVRADPERVARFEREAKLLASLNHPNIGGIHGFEQANGELFIVMELVEGETLADQIARGPIPVAEALQIARQIAEALEAAHEAGVIHRDLKPANVKVRADGTVKVLDFGLGKALTSDPLTSPASLTNSPTITSPVGVTGIGVLLGTAAYMAPEQARGKAVDKRADIWAFGCVVYEMLAGNQLFDGATATDSIALVLTKEPDWTALPPTTPGRIIELLRRCLNKDPRDRLRDIGDARLDILTLTLQPALNSPASTARDARWGTAAPWVVAALLATTLVVTQLKNGAPVSSSGAVARLELNVGIELYTNYPPGATLSRDGTRIVFAGVVGGLRQLYVRRLAEFEAIPLRGTENATMGFFSPDGSAVGFISADRQLKKVSLSDGLIVPLARDADYSAGAFWGADDRITFGRADTLWQVPASAGEATQLTTLDHAKGEIFHAWPTMLPGGQTVVFASVTGTSRDATHIEAMSIADKKRRVVVESGTFPLYASSGHLIFSRDGALIAAPFDAERLAVTGPFVRVVDNVAVDASVGMPLVALSENGSLVYSPRETSRIVWVSRQGVEQPIGDALRRYTYPRLEPQSGRIVVHADGDLWIQNTAPPRLQRLTSQSTAGNASQILTPDGKRVFFRSRTGMRWIEVDGSGESHAITGSTSVVDIPNSVSPDGSTLAFIRQTSDTSGDIYVLDLHGEAKPRVVVSTPAYEGGSQFSPDGRWIVYASDESGQMQVYVRPYPGPGQKVTVSTQGGTQPVWNRNGRELFYRHVDKMMVVDVATSPTLKMSEPRQLFEQRYAFLTATTPNYDISADGQRFVMIKDESGSGRLNVVLNWTEELKRLVPTK
jgi:dipeptidyl aminopeptidase/acylaminoacyl peptidase/predicted Ser/Thr protein kinase